MRMHPRLALLVLGATILFGERARAQSVMGACLSGDETRGRLVALFSSFVAPTTADDSVMRKALKLSIESPSDIVPVTDDAVCTHAAMALSAEAYVKSKSLSLYVLRLGTSYAVMDTTLHIGKYKAAWVFDNDWRFVDVIQAFP